GKVYDALTLSLIGDTGRTGGVFLDDVAGFVYFSQGVFVDRVRTIDYQVDAQFAFDGDSFYGANSIELDPWNNVAYVGNPIATNAQVLHAVPLQAGLIDPSPSADTVVPREVSSLRIVANGIDPATISLRVDGT